MINAELKAAFDKVRCAEDGARILLDPNSLLKAVLLGVETGEFAAVRHPVGFFYFDMSEHVDSEPGVQCRIHVWADMQQRSDGLGSIHDHSWTLTSAVLTGEIEDVNYAATSNPDGPHRFVRVSYSDAGNEFTDDGRFSLTESRRRKITAGTVYRLAADVLHTTVVTESPTVTLLIADRRAVASTSPLVLVSGETVPAATGPRSLVDPETANCALNLAMAALDRRGRRSPTIGREDRPEMQV